ncbi:hypothetical protein J6590_027645 [Homalodisca vitripennis]|nr:hypothetical protein J6590_027645 [Homalodisca vitripennis]
MAKGEDKKEVFVRNGGAPLSLALRRDQCHSLTRYSPLALDAETENRDLGLWSVAGGCLTNADVFLMQT